MPDFLRWLLNADKPGKPLPPGEFVWSPSKHFLFRQCRRAWFFRHYLAQGGWNELSADPAMHAYLLKYLATADSWMSSAAEDSLVRALMEIMPFSGEGRAGALTEAFQVQVSARLIRARDDLAHDEYLSDPKRTSFAELHYGTGEYRSAHEMLSVMQNRFRDFFALWEGSGLPEELAETDPLDWRLPPEHRLFPFAGTRISLRPWIYAVRRHCVTAWTLRFLFSGQEEAPDPRDGEEEYGLPERVFALWCARKYPEFKVRVRKIFATPDGLINRTVIPIPVSEEFVVQSVHPMLKAVNQPGGMRSDLFPKLEDPADCRFCRFRGLCETEPAPSDDPPDGVSEQS
ncbi:MAG: hypothetical protein IJS14_08430 [Lentisphaeria bacterium]|nr:hypothetical protein [Lentisphaeria bacterium]